MDDIQGPMNEARRMFVNAVSGATKDTTNPLGIGILAGILALVGAYYLFFVFLGLCSLTVFSPLATAASAPAAASYPNPYAGAAAATSPSPTSLFLSPLEALFGVMIGFVVVMTILGLAHLILARGLYQKQKWAFWGIIVVEGLNILAALIYFLTDGHNGVLFFAQIWLPLLVFAYMLASKEVRQAFKSF